MRWSNFHVTSRRNYLHVRAVQLRSTFIIIAAEPAWLKTLISQGIHKHRGLLFYAMASSFCPWYFSKSSRYGFGHMCIAWYLIDTSGVQKKWTHMCGKCLKRVGEWANQMWIENPWSPLRVAMKCYSSSAIYPFSLYPYAIHPLSPTSFGHPSSV